MEQKNLLVFFFRCCELYNKLEKLFIITIIEFNARMNFQGKHDIGGYLRQGMGVAMMVLTCSIIVILRLYTQLNSIGCRSSHFILVSTYTPFMRELRPYVQMGIFAKCKLWSPPGADILDQVWCSSEIAMREMLEDNSEFRTSHGIISIVCWTILLNLSYSAFSVILEGSISFLPSQLSAIL